MAVAVLHGWCWCCLAVGQLLVAALTNSWMQLTSCSKRFGKKANNDERYNAIWEPTWYVSICLGSSGL